jgi:hypothetical protein
MRSVYKPGGDMYEDFEKGVQYLSAEEALEYRIFINEEGRAVDINGQLIDTRNSVYVDGVLQIPTDKAIFIMNENGEILFSKYQEVGKFHHSSFTAGAEISTGGEIWIENGEIIQISNNSGHYHPSKESLNFVLDELTKRGVNVTSIKISHGY